MQFSAVPTEVFTTLGAVWHYTNVSDITTQRVVPLSSR